MDEEAMGRVHQRERTDEARAVLEVSRLLADTMTAAAAVGLFRP
jgi:hypothetical protein